MAAQCRTTVLAAALALVLTTAAAAFISLTPDLSGAWALQGSTEDYAITASSNSSLFDVTCGPRGPCTAWKTANITVVAGDALFIRFDSGASHGGTLSASGTAMTWADDSVWSRLRPANATLTVHVCPTSHEDPGWFQTLDELYETLFRWTISNVTAALSADPRRTFVPEISVIVAMYYEEADAASRSALRAMVAAGQVEFAGGGWVQPDEAITRHEDLIDQLTLGHMFLGSTLGHAPVRVSWSADPFGHSNTMAYLTALNAADAHVLGRPMSPRDPVNSQSSGLWHPMASMPDGGVFQPASTTMTYNTLGYWEPYRSMRGDMEAKNTAKAAATLLAYVEAAASRGPYESNILVMWGDDAPNQSPYAAMYPALDAVLDLLNANSSTSRITWRYSTPSVWVAALAAEKGVGAAATAATKATTAAAAAAAARALDSISPRAAAAAAALPSRPSWDMLPLVGNEFPYWVSILVIMLPLVGNEFPYWASILVIMLPLVGNEFPYWVSILVIMY